MNGKRPPVECVNYKKNAKKKNRCAEVYGDMPPKTDKRFP